MKEKIATGPNDRTKNETIAQTGEGLPDDGSSVIEVDSAGVAEVQDDQSDKETAETNRELDEEFEEDDPGSVPPRTPIGGPPD